jgi:hypothetical protein
MTCTTCRHRDRCPTPPGCALAIPEPAPKRKDPPRWAPYLGLFFAITGAVAAYVYVVFGRLIWPV